MLLLCFSFHCLLLYFGCGIVLLSLPSLLFLSFVLERWRWWWQMVAEMDEIRPILFLSLVLERWLGFGIQKLKKFGGYRNGRNSKKFGTKFSCLTSQKIQIWIKFGQILTQIHSCIKLHKWDCYDLIAAPSNHALGQMENKGGKITKKRTERICIFTVWACETSVSSRLNKKLEGNGWRWPWGSQAGGWRQLQAPPCPCSWCRRAAPPLASSQPPRERRKQAGLGFHREFVPFNQGNVSLDCYGSWDESKIQMRPNFFNRIHFFSDPTEMGEFQRNSAHSGRIPEPI